VSARLVLAATGVGGWPAARLALPVQALLALLVVLAALPGLASAQGYGLGATPNTSAFTIFRSGAPNDQQTAVGNIAWDNNPQANMLNTLDREARVSNGGVGTARFQGSIGLLKAYAAASYPSFQGPGLAPSGGRAQAFVSSSFGDTILVSGAGLALGTPVSYRVDFSIDGALSSQAQQHNAFGLAAEAGVTLRDLLSSQEVSFSWNARSQPGGVYSLILNTQVGHSLSIFGRLNVAASVAGDSIVGTFGEADFYHSALYSLSPSVAGLNTLGASGHDFLSPVPEAGSAGLLALGLAVMQLVLRRGSRRPST
jgi:hypothetical protein